VPLERSGALGQLRDERPGLVLEVFGGPGGFSEGARQIGLHHLIGIEWDEWACRTRAAAGHRFIRADVSSLAIPEWLADLVQAVIGSPPCVVFSQAGGRGGVAVMAELAELIRDMFAGRPTRALRRRNMARILRDAGWPPQRTRPTRFGRALKSRQKHKTPVRMTREQQSAAIWKAVRSASLVAEPARYIAACNPEWVALEQVREVLPLWKVYAEELRKLGYFTWTGILNAADYGVPQTRQRAILIASRTRLVHRPDATHYDARKGLRLFGDPWVSMAEALGIGATARPAPTVTAGGTASGGAEPFGHRDRDMLAAEMEAGRWVQETASRGRQGDRTQPRPMDQPSHTVHFAHAGMVWRPDHPGVGEVDGADDGEWEMRSTRSASDERRRGHPRPGRGLDEPAHTISLGSSGTSQRWALRRDRGSGMTGRSGHGGRDRPDDEPAPTITTGEHGSGPRMSWVLETNRGQAEDGTRQTVDPSSAPAPAPALTAKSGGQWVVRTSFGEPAAGPKHEGSGSHGTHEMNPLERPAHTVTSKTKDWVASFRGESDEDDLAEAGEWALRMDTQDKATLPRPVDQPAPTVQFAHRSNLAAWTRSRPATTVQGDPRIGRPGHKERERGGESQFASEETVRITVQQAAILQSFPAYYPFQGSKTAQFRQVGDAVPPLLGAHVLAMAAGVDIGEETA
jgi:DNA (cytosine-5)-methyltransferase 1